MIKGDNAIYIRVDGGPEIGAGHIVRCVSIAKEIEKKGIPAVFVSSNVDALQILSDYGYRPILVGGDPKHLVKGDAKKLKEVMVEGKRVLVDSYGVTDEFFVSCKELGLQVIYIDDLYTFELGGLKRPVRWELEAVINYSFGVRKEDYQKVYSDSSTKLLIGPQYAPVREVFKEKAASYQVRDEVKKVLITTGSTNPNKSLEKLACACRTALPEVSISIVVGNAASFDSSLKEELNVSLIKGATDLSDYMLDSDLVISAAGTTLYELCTLGVPTIAVPVVENQLLNVFGFIDTGLGFATNKLDWDVDEFEALLREFTNIPEGLQRFNRAMRLKSIGDGVDLIASNLAVFF